MRVLITSAYFHPSIGGIETVCLTLARGLAARGHAVTVATLTPGNPGDESQFPFKVVREPSPAQQIQLALAADVIWQNGISLRLGWPLLTPRPRIFAHHGPLIRLRALKRPLCMTGVNVFVSDYMRDDMGLPGVVLPNSYDAETFRIHTDVTRDRDVVYVGRFVPQKGVDTLLEAMAVAARNGRRISATIIGSGMEDDALRAQAAAVKLDVRFPGPLQGEALARAINGHRILAMPSRWEEPFGLVALEGLACGCVVIGTQSGGLPGVIGPCGPIVPKNDPQAFANALVTLLGDPSALAAYRAHAPEQLAKFSEQAFIDGCETILRDCASGSSRMAKPAPSRLKISSRN